MRAVKLRRQGQSRTASGGMLEAHGNTIGRWVADHAAGGIKALKIRQRGRKEGAKRRWSAAQEAAVQDDVALNFGEPVFHLVQPGRNKSA